MKRRNAIIFVVFFGWLSKSILQRLQGASEKVTKRPRKSISDQSELF